MELIKIPFQVIATSILRLCNSPVLPFNFLTVTELFKSGLQDLQQDNNSALDLTSLIAQLEKLEKNITNLHNIIEEKLLAYKKESTDRGSEADFQKINACLMELSRILLPVLATEAGKYGQDLWGIKFKPIPRLQPLRKLNLMAIDSDEYKALRTSLVIERNRVSDALALANRTVVQALEGDRR